jgi:hypothetical protein
LASTQSGFEQQLKNAGQEAGWPWKLLFLSGSIFVTAAVVFAGMQYGLYPYLEAQAKKTDQDINKLSSAVSDEQVKNFTNFYSQLNNIQSLLKNHGNAVNFIDLLEIKTFKNVYFKSMSVDLKGNIVKLDGMAPSYEVLAQQMEVFKEAEGISDVVLDGANLSEEKIGGVNFSIRLMLK